jgi:hypothetical protein
MGKSSKSGKSSKGVSQVRLSQKTGSANSFGGYTKAKRSNGSFTMKKSGKR